MRNLIYDYWDNFDRTYLGKRWGKDLAVYLERKMADEPCDHTLKYTEKFFSKRFPVKRIYQLWIVSHYCCDCEVVINTGWREGLDWRSEPEKFKVNSLDNILIYKDGSQLDLRLYKNGLKEGNILRLRKDLHMKDLDGNIVEKTAKGTLFRVLPMAYDSWDFGHVQLVSLDGSHRPRSYKDDEKIFKELELIDAIDYFKDMIAKNTNMQDSCLYRNLALAYKNEEKLDAALRWYQKAVEKSIEESGINSGSTFLSKKDLANEYFNQGQYEPAVSLFSEALKLNTADQTHTAYTKNFKEKIKTAQIALKEQKKRKDDQCP